MVSIYKWSFHGGFLWANKMHKAKCSIVLQLLVGIQSHDISESQIRLVLKDFPLPSAVITGLKGKQVAI